MKNNHKKRAPAPEKTGALRKIKTYGYTLPRPPLGERTTLYLEIPYEQAGLLRQILQMGFRQAWECSNPRLIGGSGVLQLAIARLHASIEQQLRHVEGANDDCQ